MTYIELPEQTTLPPITFDFAVEAYAARHFHDDDYFFIWQTKPTVILGRNQLLRNEVNIDYCRKHDVFISRRKSGGGCVYSDEGNIMFSFICREPNVKKMFANCMHLAADALHRIGVPVNISGRNDILLDGKKVSGAAFYRTGERSVMHNTLLVHSDLSRLYLYVAAGTEDIFQAGDVWRQDHHHHGGHDARNQSTAGIVCRRRLHLR